MKTVIGILSQFTIIAIALFLVISWPVNLYKLTRCDFEPDYKCEVMHGAGLIPAVSFVTVWFGTDN